MSSQFWFGSSFTILGIVSLLPWNLFINAGEYFLYKFRNLNDTNVTSYYQDVTENSFAVVGSLTSVVALFLNTILTVRLSSRVRLISAHLLLLLGLLLTLFFTFIVTDDWQRSFFGITLLLLGICVVSSTFIQGGSLGIAALFPSYCIECVLLGQSIAGVIVSIMAIATEAIGGEVTVAASIYFSLGVVFTIVSFFSYAWLAQTQKLKDLLKEYSPSSNASDVEYERLYEDDASEISTGNSVGSFSNEPLHAVFTVLRKVSLYACTVVITYAITLSCFPALNTRVRSFSNDSTWNRYFTLVACFLLFNIGDCLGRLITRRFRRPRFGHWSILFWCSLRVLFVVAFLFSNVQRRHFTSVLLPYDGIFMVLTLLFAITNGYFTSLAFIYTPKCVSEQEAEIAGSLVGFFLAIGIVVGSALSFLVVKLV